MPILRQLNIDCRHYRHDRPCRPHKQFGVVCEHCEYYDPVRSRILIVKLGATGDVLRTTALLGSVKDLYPDSHITWICGKSSFELIRHNPWVDWPLLFSQESLVLLDAMAFDVCINCDLAPEAAALASRVKAQTKKGFGMAPNSSIHPFHPEAETWFEMSMWDDCKKQNTQTYQSHMRRILGAPETNHAIHTPLLPKHVEKAKVFAAQADLDASVPIIGFNVGAGDRWQHKKWTIEGFVELAERIDKHVQARIMILYGPVDRERARHVMQAMTVPFVDAGLHPSLLEFFAFLDLCTLIVTGDTFALHAALGLDKKVVCLVGPTSARELELYNKGVILQSQMDCLGCYRTECEKDPHCMNSLTAETVFEAVQHQL
ncbi:hypothetical protein GF373_15230 [bacterium]|nr:hypothetical protein [bacterium]